MKKKIKTSSRRTPYPKKGMGAFDEKKRAIIGTRYCPGCGTNVTIHCEQTVMGDQCPHCNTICPGI